MAKHGLSAGFSGFVGRLWRQRYKMTMLPDESRITDLDLCTAGHTVIIINACPTEEAKEVVKWSEDHTIRELRDGMDVQICQAANPRSAQWGCPAPSRRERAPGPGGSGGARLPAASI